MVTDEYRAYLLRLWRVEDDGGNWRARLENVETGEAQGFASLEKLIEFLQGLDGWGISLERMHRGGVTSSTKVNTYGWRQGRGGSPRQIATEGMQRCTSASPPGDSRLSVTRIHRNNYAMHTADLPRGDKMHRKSSSHDLFYHFLSYHARRL